MSVLSQDVVRYFTSVVISEGEGLDLRTQITIMESHEELRAEVSELQDVVEKQQHEIEAMRTRMLPIGGKER